MHALFFYGKKCFLLLLCLFLLLPLLTACTDKVGTGSVDTSTVLKVDGFKVTMDEYRYLCYKYKAEYDQGDPAYWQSHPEAETALKEDVLRELCAVYAVHSLAEEHDVSLDDSHIEAINREITSMIDQAGSEDAYFAAMQHYHLTGDQIWREYTLDYLKELLYARVTGEMNGLIPSDDAKIEAAIDADEFFCVRYAMIQDNTADGSGKEACRDYANKLQSQLASGGDFDSLISSVVKDPSDPSKVLLILTKCPAEYHIKDSVEANAEAAILATPIGAYTGAIEIDDTFFVYQRLQVDRIAMETTEFENLRTQYLERAFSRLLSERAKALYETIKFKSAYGSAFSVSES